MNNPMLPPTDSPSIFERSVPGRVGFSLPAEPADTAAAIDAQIPAALRRTKSLSLPEVSELDVVRHFTKLSTRTIGLDTAFYPLGSCTMKYNPRLNERAAQMNAWRNLHPDQPVETMQGLLKIVYETQTWLGDLTGLPATSFQPAAGAHGELTALMVARAHFDSRGENLRRKVIVADTAHGTNPASVARCGMMTVEIKSNADGRIDLENLKQHLGDDVACVMITNPNTLGLFENSIHEVADAVHAAGALIYMDGANFNAIMGRVRPADFGADMMHINVHKTFSCPHGGGGPGAGPICVRDFLAPYLPRPWVVKNANGTYSLQNDCPQTVGRVRSYIGNLANAVRTWTYLRTLGADGVREASGAAVLAANYMARQLKDAYEIPFGERCMHEFVLSANRQKAVGVRALDLAKGLLDLGYHPPTIYFPLLVPEAMMIEPTETESKETLDAFCAAMLQLNDTAHSAPDTLLAAPVTTAVRRLDEGQAARKPILTWPMQ